MGKFKILLFDHIFPRTFSPFRIKATKQADRSIFNETMATANNSACGNLLNDLTFRKYGQTFKKYVESILEKLTNLSKTYCSDCRRDMEDIKRFVNDCLGWEDELCKVYKEMNWKIFIEKRMRDMNFQNDKLEMQLKLKELQMKIKVKRTKSKL